MVRGFLKNRTFKRVRVSLPGGGSKIQYRRARNGAPQCADCGGVLKGTARGSPSQIMKLSKSERRPDRLFGGVLCSACSKERIILRAREMAKLFVPKQEVTETNIEVSA